MEEVFSQQSERLISKPLTLNQGELDKQQLAKVVECLLTGNAEQQLLTSGWQRWLIENKILYVPDHSLVQEMTQNGIGYDLAVRAVQATTKALAIAMEALQVKPQIPHGWHQWILDNKARKVPDHVLIQNMVQSGIDNELATNAVQQSDTRLLVPAQDLQSSILPSHLGNPATEVATQLLAKLESILAVKRKLEELSPNFGTIKRVVQLTKQEFLENYYATGTPVIITGMMNDWPAMVSWSPAYIKAKYGSSQVEIQMGREADVEYEINANQHKQVISLNKYVDMVVNGGETNDYYLVANNQILEHEDLKSLLDDVVFPDFLDSANLRQRVFFWFGPAGTITPLHHDVLNLMMAHVSGRKRWRLISPNYTPLLYNFVGVYSKIDLENPNYETYPLFKQVKIIETVLEPGELIFVPVGWWHQVKALDISLSLSFSNFVFPNDYAYQHPNIQWEASQTSIYPKEVHSDERVVTLTQARMTQSTINTSSTTNSSDRKSLIFDSQPLTDEGIKSNITDGYWVDEVFRNELLIISFGFVSWDGPPRFDFYGRTKKLEGLTNKPINRILLRDFKNAWYHRGVLGLGNNVDQVSDRLKQLIENISPSRVVTIGQSMGAYAAIMFGQLLGVDQVVAFGPLSFLDSQKSLEIEDRRWLSIMEDLESNPPEVRYFDLVALGQSSIHFPKIEIFYGKKPDADTPGNVNLDHIHAHRLATLSNCFLHPYEDSDHAIVQYLIDHKQIDQVLLKLL